VVKVTKKQTGQADAGPRAMKAWAARVAGLTWAEAAEIAGFSSAGNACRAVTRYFGTVPSIEREDQRALWRERLEYLWAQARVDVQQQRPGAIRAGVALAQRASALDGLDAPVRVQINPDAEKLDELVHKLVAMQGIHHEEEGDILALEEGADGVFSARDDDDEGDEEDGDEE
jgi:hypothetical protein